MQAKSTKQKPTLFRKSVILVGLALASACGRGGDQNSGGSSTQDQQNAGTVHFERQVYQFIHNECDTGVHEFLSATAEGAVKELCKALQDHSLNHFCAEDAREDYFHEKCPDLVWQSYSSNNSVTDSSI